MAAEMREDEVQACAFASWYDDFKGVTFKSEIITLPESFVQYLNADGIRLRSTTTTTQRPEGDDDDQSISSGGSGDSEGSLEAADFPELESAIVAAVARLNGAVLPKLNWSSPKDALWMNLGSLKCTSAEEVITLLKASDFVAHDLCHAFDHCGTDRKAPDAFTLVLRRWHSLHESNEFRCFVSDGRLVAVSQRHISGFYEHLTEQAESEELLEAILTFFREGREGKGCAPKDNFGLERYAFDVYVDMAPRRKVWLVDFSPWGPTTDPCMFDWEELAALAVAEEQPGARPEFRAVQDEADRRTKVEQYHSLPVELAEMGRGEGLEDLIKKADDMLCKKGYSGDVGGAGAD